MLWKQCLFGSSRRRCEMWIPRRVCCSYRLPISLAGCLAQVRHLSILALVPKRLDVPEWTQKYSFKTLFEWSYSEEWPWQPLGQFKFPVSGDTAALVGQLSVAISLIWLIEVHKSGVGYNRNIQGSSTTVAFSLIYSFNPFPCLGFKRSDSKVDRPEPTAWLQACLHPLGQARPGASWAQFTEPLALPIMGSRD